MLYRQLTKLELNEFNKLHEEVLPNRTENYKTLLMHETSHPEINIKPIIKKALEILRIKYDNFNSKYFTIEFHQRNSGFERNQNNKFCWHRDDYNIRDFPVYTVLFYLRKDKTIKGGDLEYKLNSSKKVHRVSPGDILCFPGDMSHYPQPTSGFGCRDLIAFFTRRL